MQVWAAARVGGSKVCERRDEELGGQCERPSNKYVEQPRGCPERVEQS